ncbi:MAG: molybdate ABC transporter substrate-binding protein [Chloroflexi bacterium]|nr:molybdate ABC transporter substrate-binding protein [Chloroflexota bacterium]
MPRQWLAVALASLYGVVLVACSPSPQPPAAPTRSTAQSPTQVQPTFELPSTEVLPRPSPTALGRQSDDPSAVVVFADSALGAALADLASAFMVSNADVTGVSYKLETSDKLIALIQQGADADVLITTDNRQMATLQQANRLDGPPAVLVRSGLVIIARKPNPQGIQGLRDLANAGVRFIVPEPTSATTATILATFDKANADPAYGADFRSKVERNILARDGDGQFVVGRVAAGEVSAAVVYSTDVDAQSRAQLQVIDIPDALNTLVDYPMTVLKNGTNTRGGQAFVNYLRSPKAQDALAAMGFIRAAP